MQNQCRCEVIVPAADECKNCLYGNCRFHQWKCDISKFFFFFLIIFIPFVSSWNNYFTPALILHDDKKKTLPILIAQLRAADWLKFDMGQVYVMITFSILPVIVVYLILSKHIVQGIALGSVKG